jgi:hypothetical protein
MRAQWMIAVAASVTLASAAPADVLAQGRSGKGAQAEQRGPQARGQQQARDQQQRQQAQQRQAQQQRQEAQQRQAQQRVSQAEARLREAERQQRDARDQRARAIVIDRSRVDPRDARRDDRDRYDERGIWGTQTSNRGNGPAFCRSGEGHPVWGRQWCRDKGWALGNSRTVRDGRDIDVWRDIILGRDRDRRRYDQTLSRSVLGDILGAVLVNRMESYGRQYGSGPMTGRWIPDNRGNVLQLSIGGVPIARLVDSDGDGRLNDVLLRN